MPHLRLYHTKDDLRKANQAKCQQYYLKYVRYDCKTSLMNLKE